MLGKLMKYEWKATARLFLPFYGAVLLFALINRLFFQFGGYNITGILALPAGFAMVIYIMAIVATFVLTVAVMIQRFYKNLLGDEGYLMFTLPVKPHTHILAKLLVSAAWIVISVLTVIISLIAMLAQKGFFAGVLKVIDEFFKLDVPFNKGAMLTWFIITVIVSLFAGILIIYASVALGQLFSRHKLAASFGAFIVINIATQILSSILLAICYAVDPQAFAVNAANTIPSSAFFNTVFWGSLGLNIVMGVGCYAITHLILNKKLNLE